MNGLSAHLGLSLRLHFRNRMALLYGYLFPLIYLAAFWVVYRHEKSPLFRHMGELLTVAVLSGACFGLPTTLVGERERGVWRRYRLTPIPTWALVGSTVVARYFILLTAGLLQLAVALLIGMAPPVHPLGLFVAFSFVSFAFIGLGLVIAMLADTVPAVQALGQCIFLPMLIIGGVAVQLASLPPWAQHVSAFFPGRYAVEAIQACVGGGGLSGARFSLLALVMIGGAGCLAGAKLFRWDAQQRFTARGGKAWLFPVFAAWIAVGALAESRGRIARVPAEEETAAPLVRAAPIASGTSGVPLPPSPIPRPAWTRITDEEIAAVLKIEVPPDEGIVSPFAAEGELVDDFIQRQVDGVRAKLPNWPPAREDDEVQRIRNLVCVAAVPDALQMIVERYLPPVVLQYLECAYGRENLVKILTWVALHPDEGQVVMAISDLGIAGEAVDEGQVRERVGFYSIKFLRRLTAQKMP